MSTNASGALGTYTIDTAPRDVDTLSKLGRFQLRRLADELKILDDDEKKQSFQGSTPREMAETLVTAFKQYDAAKSGAPKNGANGMAHFNGGNHAHEPADQAVSEEPVQEVVREPVTSKTRAKASPTTPSPASQETSIPVGVVDLSPVLQALEAQQTALNGLAKVFKEDNRGYQKRVEDMSTAILSVAQTQRYLISLVVMLCENSPSINASRWDILTTAVEDAEGILKDLSNAMEKVSGKE